jgi:hypothetical protein
MRKMMNSIKYPVILFVFIILAVSCENPGTYDGNGGGGDAELYFVNFEKQDDGSVLFYTNNPKMIGPLGYKYWCIGTYDTDPMEDYRVTVHKVSGSAAGGLGVVFAAQDKENFLFVLINTSGSYKVGKVVEGNFTILDPADKTWIPSDKLFKGYVSNTIRISYDQDAGRFWIYFNDDETGVWFEDHDAPVFTGGYYGYICYVDGSENFPETAVEVHFYQEDPADIGM